MVVGREYRRVVEHRSRLNAWFSAAVTIPGSTRCAAYGIPERFGYFQSGVLLINLKRWREERIFDRLQDYVAHNAEKIVDADQDVLNASPL